MKRRRVIAVMIVLVLLVSGSILFWPIGTHPDSRYPEGIYTVKEIQLKEQRVRVMIRSRQAGNPVLLMVPDSFGAHLGLYSQFLRSLEPYFTVVTFSYPDGYHRSDASLLQQLTEDILRLSDYIKKEVFAEEVILAGHGIGSIIAAEVLRQNAAQYLAYIGISQYTDYLMTDAAILDKLENKASSNEKQAQQIAVMKEKIAARSTMLDRSWIQKQKRTALRFHETIAKVQGMLFQSEMNGWEALRYELLQDELWPVWEQEMIAKPWQLESQITVPCVLIGGRYDYLIPSDTLVEQAQQANCEEAYFFDASAHFPHLEEESLFYQRVLDFYHKLNREK